MSWASPPVPVTALAGWFTLDQITARESLQRGQPRSSNNAIPTNCDCPVRSFLEFSATVVINPNCLGMAKT